MSHFIGLWVYVCYGYRLGLMFISTSLGPFLMHYSKHVVKISTLKAGETVFVFIIMPLCHMHSHCNKAPFIAVKYNKLSTIPPL